MDGEIELLRHALATLAYRGGKALRGVPGGFSGFRAAPGSRSAGEILAHVGDLLDWAMALAAGERRWREVPPGAWEDDVRRFHSGLAALDRRLESAEPLAFPPGRIFQGPVADALTHIGQIALLRRLAGAPVRGENYFEADIVAGRVGAGQPEPRREFD